MIRSTFIFLLVLISLSCNSQELNITLKINYKMTKVKNDSVRAPFLVITYENLSGEKIFFPKIYNNPCSLPRFLSLSPFKAKNIDLKNLIDQSTNDETRMIVVVGGGINTNSYWDIVDEDQFDLVECEYDCMNDLLDLIYKSLFGEHYLINELTNSVSNVLSKNNLIFLDPYDVYSESFNLIGFSRLHGKYTFTIIHERFDREYRTNSRINNGKFEWDNQSVPEELNGYKYYFKKFSSNSVVFTSPLFVETK